MRFPKYNSILQYTNYIKTTVFCFRFGADDRSTTTQRLPVEALGDRDLVNRISKLPVDQQPFWFINWQALEAHRQKPQTWPEKTNIFIDSQSNRLQ